MRPLRLTVQGFMPFRQHADVDFSDMELYAIQGQTGSGKSALLDAMTFALYGSTPRLGARGLDALISQGERGLAVSFEFESGGETYRVARTHGRKQAEREVRFERLVDGRFVSLAENKKAQIQEHITRAVGLDYDAFTRAILLPQGQFDRFLRGSGRERQELLGALMNMEHVRRMAEYAGAKRSGLAHELAARNALLDGEYRDLSDDVIAAWDAERDAALADAERLGQDRERLNATLAHERTREGWHADLNRARARLRDLRTRTPDVQAGAQRAERARSVAGLLPLLDTLARAEEGVRRAGQAVEARTAEAQRAAAQLTAAQDAFQRADGAANLIPEWEARADALRDAERDARLLRQYGGTPDLTHTHPLAWDEDAYLRARDAATRLDVLKRERTEITAERAGLNAQATRLQTEEALQAQQLAELERVKDEGVRVKGALDAAQARLLAARERAGLAAHRAHLHVGQPCPLCEQTVRALPSGPLEDLGALTAEVSALEATRDRLRERFADLRAGTRERDARLKREHAEYTDWTAAVDAREREAQQQAATLTGDPHDDARRILTGLARTVRAAGGDPAGARRALLNQIAGARTALDAARADLSAAQTATATATATLDAARVTLGDREAERAHVHHDATAALTRLNLTADAARATALPDAEITRLEGAARTHAADLERLHAEERDLLGKLGDAPFDPAHLRQLERDLADLDGRIRAVRERAGALGEQVRAGREKLARKRDLEREAARLSRDLDTWTALTNALKTNEFQQYLLQEVEQQLLARAGELLFEISDGRYRLVLDGTEYSVQDLWNAGETRGVKTLSGGETFLASLALAIALSDYLAGTRVLGALFLDEGFGTLDPQALDAVAGALENLRTQGRMVGVITHVDSLSERLPARFLVTKSVAGSNVQKVEG